MVRTMTIVLTPATLTTTQLSLFSLATTSPSPLARSHVNSAARLEHGFNKIVGQTLTLHPLIMKMDPIKSFSTLLSSDSQIKFKFLCPSC